MGQGPFGRIRIGDTEREQSVSLLAEHFASGRLSPAEHEQRHAAAKAAVVRAEIELLFADLPAPHPDLTAAEPPALTGEQLAAIEAGRETRLSAGLFSAAVGLVLFGLPISVVLGFTLDLWWLLGAVGGLAIAGLAGADMAKKRKIQD